VTCSCLGGFSSSGFGSSLSCTSCAVNRYSAATSCPPGYNLNPNDSLCYMFVSSATDWLTAAQVCNEAYGGWLVTVSDSSTKSYLYSLAGGNVYWMGLTDVVTAFEFVWLYGSSSYTSWYWSQPDNAGGVERCVVGNMQGSSSWNDYPCSLHFAYVCQTTAQYLCLNCPLDSSSNEGSSTW
jgi:hypothetical protein